MNFYSPQLPQTRARLIRDGITREEYARRFGMDDAAVRAFSNRESDKKMTAVIESIQPKPALKFTIQELILALLQKDTSGLNADEISRALVINKRSIQNALSLLKSEGKARSERFPAAMKAGLYWFATSFASEPNEPHGIRDFYPTVIDIQKVVANHFSSSFRAIMSESRTPSVVRARFAAIYLSEKLKGLSTTDLARRFARQDHTTVIHSLKRAREMMVSEPDFAVRLDAAERELTRGEK